MLDPKVRAAMDAAERRIMRRDADGKDPTDQEMDEAEDSDTEQESEESEDEEEENVEYQKPQLEWPAAAIFVGHTYSGKTTLLKDLVNKDDFDNVFVISATTHESEMEDMVHDKQCILDDFSDEAIEELMKMQIGAKEELGQYPNTLLIFDDFIGLPFDVHKSKRIKTLATAGRHFGLSMILSSQHLKSVPPALRQNLRYMMLGNNSDRAIHDLAEDLAPPHIGRPRFKRELLHISKRNCFEFLCFDVRNQAYTIYKAPAPTGTSGGVSDQATGGKRKRAA